MTLSKQPFDIGDVVHFQSRECVVDKAEYHPGGNYYQGQGDIGCESPNNPCWVISLRALNSDGSYNKNGDLWTLNFHDGENLQMFPVTRKMQLVLE